MLGTSLHNISTPSHGESEATPSRRQERRVRRMSRRREDSMRQKTGGGGVEGARPNRNRQQQQDVYINSKTSLYEVEGDMKHDGQQ